MKVTRETATGVEHLSLLQAVLVVCQEAHVTVGEAIVALRSGECRTYLSVLTLLETT